VAGIPEQQGTEQMSNDGGMVVSTSIAVAADATDV
jgi:hypothetical protein